MCSCARLNPNSHLTLLHQTAYAQSSLLSRSSPKPSIVAGRLFLELIYLLGQIDWAFQLQPPISQRNHFWQEVRLEIWKSSKFLVDRSIEAGRAGSLPKFRSVLNKIQFLSHAEAKWFSVQDENFVTFTGGETLARISTSSIIGLSSTLAEGR